MNEGRAGWASVADATQNEHMSRGGRWPRVARTPTPTDQNRPLYTRGERVAQKQAGESRRCSHWRLAQQRGVTDDHAQDPPLHATFDALVGHAPRRDHLTCSTRLLLDTCLVQTSGGGMDRLNRRWHPVRGGCMHGRLIRDCDGGAGSGSAWQAGRRPGAGKLVRARRRRIGAGSDETGTAVKPVPAGRQDECRSPLRSLLS